ncbi:MAG: hypothetical protein WCX32_03720 [Clostridia bacterium]
MFIENLTKKDIVKFYKQCKVPVLDIYPFDRDLQQTYGFGYCVINCKKKLGQNIYDLMINGNISYVTDYNLYFNNNMANSEYAHIQKKWTIFMFEQLLKNFGPEYATKYQHSFVDYTEQVKQSALKAKYVATQEQGE